MLRFGWKWPSTITVADVVVAAAVVVQGARDMADPTGSACVRQEGGCDMGISNR